jgi:hypothetical protein
MKFIEFTDGPTKYSRIIPLSEVKDIITEQFRIDADEEVWVRCIFVLRDGSLITSQMYPSLWDTFVEFLSSKKKNTFVYLEDADWNKEMHLDVLERAKNQQKRQWPGGCSHEL